MSERIPLHVITGFLGSGKTTLLNRLLRDPAWADSAILINEIGAVSIDHDLVEQMESGDDLDIVVLRGGCTCCTLRGDLVAALRELYARRAQGLVPPFARVVLETTGLADPAPVIFTLAADPALRHKFERGTIVTTFDAVHGLAQIQRHPEASKQIAVADRIVLTKTDLDVAAPRAALIAAIQRLNPAATIRNAQDATAPATLLAGDDASHPIDDYAYGSHKAEHENVERANPVSADRDPGEADHHNRQSADAKKLGDGRPNLLQFFAGERVLGAEHSPQIASVAITLDQPVEWSPFAVWLTMFLHAHGEKLLRFKAFLDVSGWPNPVALDGIHHMIYPPRHIGAWPRGRRLSRLVFIGQDLAVGRIEPSLRAFLGGEYAA